MEKKLNTKVIQDRLTEIGLSQSKLSVELSVTREAVSQWLKNETFPRPDKLLKLGQILSLKYAEIVFSPNEYEPIIAFRKVGNSITKTKHIKRAKETGYSLEQLVPFLPFETLTKSRSFNCPSLEYNYIQSAVKAIRILLNISQIKIEISELINYFSQSKTIIIPILAGNKKNHENALHIYLPKSATNWVYVNLDTNELDFKFWLVHELGHILTPQLHDDYAEEFADNFAGAFLFPEEIASLVYNSLTLEKNKKNQIDIIFSNAKRYTISAYTVYKEINKYAQINGFPEINLGDSLFIHNSKFIKQFDLISKNIFGNKKPTVGDYITVVTREFKTPFFEILKIFLQQNEISSSFVRSLFNLATVDSIEIFNYLKNVS